MLPHPRNQHWIVAIKIFAFNLYHHSHFLAIPLISQLFHTGHLNRAEQFSITARLVFFWVDITSFCSIFIGYLMSIRFLLNCQLVILNLAELSQVLAEPYAGWFYSSWTVYWMTWLLWFDCSWVCLLSYSSIRVFWWMHC